MESWQQPCSCNKAWSRGGARPRLLVPLHVHSLGCPQCHPPPPYWEPSSKCKSRAMALRPSREKQGFWGFPGLYAGTECQLGGWQVGLAWGSFFSSRRGLAGSPTPNSDPASELPGHKQPLPWLGPRAGQGSEG